MDFSDLTGSLGKILLVFGAVLAGIGLLLMLVPRIPWLGRLPGDIVIRRESFTFYFPLATCLLVSLLLSLIIRFFRS